MKEFDFEVVLLDLSAASPEYVAPRKCVFLLHPLFPLMLIVLFITPSITGLSNSWELLLPLSLCLSSVFLECFPSERQVNYCLQDL